MARKKVPTREIRQGAKPLFVNNETDATELDFRNREYAKRAFEAVFFHNVEKHPEMGEND